MLSSDLTDRLKLALTRADQQTSDFDLNPDVELPDNRKLRPAAVLILFEHTDTGPVVHLTKRSSKLKHHAGQIAFPGGKKDQDDANLTATALREAQEEIGLPSGHVQVLGTLPSHETVTGFLATPILAELTKPFDAVIDPSEVSELFKVPLSHVLSASSFAVESRTWMGRRRSYYVAPYGPYYIWGATARMLYMLAQLMEDT